MNEMAEEKSRVDFNAPESLVERADAIADLLNISRTQLLIDALEEEIASLTTDDRFRRQLAEAYYDDRIDYELVEAIVGTEEALRMKLLQESIDREPPEPQLVGPLPTDEEFYDGNVLEWTEDEDESTAGDEAGSPS